VTDHIRCHIRQYLDTQQTTQAALERAAGLAEGTLVKIMKGYSSMSPRTFNRMAPLVNWTSECEAECTANNERLQRIRRAGKPGAEPARVPWPVTRDHAKAGKHLYATVRML
jgi:hypothetical protein